MKLSIYAHIELNEIEIYAAVNNGENFQVLRNKDTIQELIQRGLLNAEKLAPLDMPEEVYSYYNGGGTTGYKAKEVLFVKLKHPMF